MLSFITLSVTLTLLFSQSVLCKVGFDGSYQWPLKLKKQLSSGFGDIRPGRFHMGLDLRTDSKEGVRVYAPEDGYVWRLKTSYTGYGKALYIKGVSGRIYVFGHLQKYNWDIGTYLRENQVENKRYYQDIYLEEGELQVKRGEFIARTGQSGAGAPHLHFEVRNPDDHPTNPLYYNIDFKDKSAPKFEAVWLAGLDKSTLYAGGKREIMLTPVYDRKTGRYSIADTVIISGRFAVKAAIGDDVGKGSFTLGPSHIRFLIDGRLYHEIDYDQLCFDENIYSLLDRDYDPIKEEYKRVFNLYRKSGNRLTNYQSDVDGDGSFEDSIGGLHTALIEASDASGNTSRLEFAFYCHPFGEILAPFNKADFADSLVTFIYEDDHSRVYFDSAALLLSGDVTDAETTRVILSPQIRIEDNSLTLLGNFGHTTNYQLQFFNRGRSYPAYYFSTEKITPQGQKAITSVDATILEKGVLFEAEAFSPGINWLQAEIVTDIGSERRFYRKTGNRAFTLFYCPGQDINSIESIITRGPVGFRPDTLNLPIHCVRVGKASTTVLRPGNSLVLDDGQLFDNVLLSVRDTIIPMPKTGYYINSPFILGPETCSFADWADLLTELPDDLGDPSKIGLYVFDEEKGWLWAGGEYDPVTRLLHSPLGGAGILAIIADTTAPIINDLNIRQGGRIKSDRPPITFKLDEELSGIENDLNFNVTIDDEWMVPEYDPERKVFVGKPHWRLTGGRHKLKIEVHDRCGNKTVVTRTFMVGAKIGP